MLGFFGDNLFFLSTHILRYFICVEYFINSSKFSVILSQNISLPLLSSFSPSITFIRLMMEFLNLFYLCFLIFVLFLCFYFYTEF